MRIPETNIFYKKADPTGLCSCTYLLMDGKRGLIIDPGGLNARRRLFRLLSEAGSKLSDIEIILLTHSHFDHASFANATKLMADARVYAHPTAGSTAHANPLSENLYWILDETVREGDVLPWPGRLTVLETPGHSPDHISFAWKDEGVLFSGDAMQVKNGHLVMPPLLIPSTIDGEAKSSYAKLIAMNRDYPTICPGHRDILRT
ncbi:MBL fold metallo-hydrolase [Candidatus Woesearchaeota archaeon]|nr:MBL fold metallo-hydrolase [Candidatus Woesearchaeota archaeon]